MQVVAPAAVVLYPHLKPSCTWGFVNVNAHEHVGARIDRTIHSFFKVNVFIAITNHIHGNAVVLFKLVTAIPGN